MSNGRENLIPNSERSPEELRRMTSKGGKKSGEVRRRKANFRKTLNLLLTAEIDSPEWTPILEALGLDSTLESAVNGAMIKEALSGNVKAYEAIAKYAGQNDRTDQDLKEQIAKINLLKAQRDKVEQESQEASQEPEKQQELEYGMNDPHDVIIPEFWDILDDTEHEHQIITSGRAGTKSSFSGVLGISTIVNEEPAAVVVLRKRHNKIRKTVYKEMIRAITRLGMDKSDFEIGITPMEIRHKATGNVIYFAGSDSIDDTKGIIDEDKPIRLVILDELTEFFDVGEGEEELTNIEATFVRGNDEGFRMVYLYNPPKNPNAAINIWCQKMELREDVIHKHVDYRDVPISWLGKKLLESADRLKETDFKLYRWVWLGECIGVDDLIYYMFNESHIREPEAERYKLIGIGVDYGQQNATTYQAAGLNINKKRFEGLDEFYHSGRDTGKQKSPSDYAKELIQLTDTLHEKYSCSIFYVYIDPSAKGLAEEIKRLAMQCTDYGIAVRDAENTVETGIQRVQKCLTYNVLTVSDDQQNLIREMGTYEYDPKSIQSGKEKPMKIDDHCVDALRYLIMGLWDKIKYFLPAGEREE
ncbi:PBSX family phage terminase large subunit [Blautia liquoris]|nr:PBSX family phage terminase large subunit [Blautia liquoris]